MAIARGRPAMILPPEARPLALALLPALSNPTYHRLLALAAAILTTGRRTVANLLRTVGGLAPGHRTSYQRALSSARWSGLTLVNKLHPEANLFAPPLPYAGT